MRLEAFLYFYVMIEDKDFIIKELKKAVAVLAKLLGYQKANQYELMILN